MSQEDEREAKRPCLDAHMSNTHEVDFDNFMMILNGETPVAASSPFTAPSTVDVSFPIMGVEDAPSLFAIPPSDFQIIPFHCFEDPKIIRLSTIVTGPKNQLEVKIREVTAAMNFAQMGSCLPILSSKITKQEERLSGFCGIANPRNGTVRSKSNYARQSIELCDGVLVFREPKKKSQTLENIIKYAKLGIWNKSKSTVRSHNEKPVLVVTDSCAKSYRTGRDQFEYPAKSWINDSIRIYNFLLEHKITRLYITGNEDSYDPTWYERIANILRFSLNKWKPASV